MKDKKPEPVKQKPKPTLRERLDAPGMEEAIAKKAAQLAGSAVRVVKLSTSWCGPCRAMAPAWKAFKEDHPELAFDEIDADTEAGEALFKKYDLPDSVPQILFLDAKGKLLVSFDEACTRKKLEALLAEAKK